MICETQRLAESNTKFAIKISLLNSLRYELMLNYGEKSIYNFLNGNGKIESFWLTGSTLI